MYEDQFGLSEPPFRLTPDARFFFESRTHKRAGQYLAFGLAQAEGFVVVTGEIGAGKTMLAERLMDELDGERTRAVRVSTAQVDPADLLRLVAERLGAGARGAEKGDLLNAIEQRLGVEADAGRRVLLIVDEAQALTTGALEELRMLSNFARAGRPLLQILLLGQPEFRDRIAHAPELEQLRQRVIASHHLDAMGADEVAPYILHRLDRAGWRGRPAFTPDAFEAFHELSGGIPRRLNMLAHRALLAAAVDGRDAIDVDVVAEAASETPLPEPVRPDVPPSATVEDRLEAIEAQLASQDAALRRILSLLVRWVDGEPQPGSRPQVVGNDAF